MSSHSWSGWPGAWCLNCGCEDPFEIALGVSIWDINEEGDIVFSDEVETEIKSKMICPAPGINNFNPYVKG